MIDTVIGLCLAFVLGFWAGFLALAALILGSRG